MVLSRQAMSRWPIQWFVIGLVTLAIEFGLKYAAWEYRYESEIINFPPYVSFNIVYVENRFSAFGMMRSVPDWANKSLLALSVVFLVWLTYQQTVSDDSTAVTRRGIFCFIVGAIGNMADRLTVGAVVDYVDIQLGEHGSYYALAWNLSDLVINLGFAHIMYDALFTKDNVEPSAAPRKAEEVAAVEPKTTTASKRKTSKKTQ